MAGSIHSTSVSACSTLAAAATTAEAGTDVVHSRRSILEQGSDGAAFWPIPDTGSVGVGMALVTRRLRKLLARGPPSTRTRASRQSTRGRGGAGSSRLRLLFLGVRTHALALGVFVGSNSDSVTVVAASGGSPCTNSKTATEGMIQSLCDTCGLFFVSVLPNIGSGIILTSVFSFSRNPRRHSASVPQDGCDKNRNRNHNSLSASSRKSVPTIIATGVARSIVTATGRTSTTRGRRAPRPTQPPSPSGGLGSPTEIAMKRQ